MQKIEMPVKIWANEATTSIKWTNNVLTDCDFRNIVIQQFK